MNQLIDPTALLPSGQSFDFWEREQIYFGLYVIEKNKCIKKVILGRAKATCYITP